MNRIKELREEKKLSMAECARQLKIPYTTYVNYEKAEREPNSEMLIKLSKFFNVSVDYLICRSEARSAKIKNILPLPDFKEVPLLGTIACGEPLLASENIEYLVRVDSKLSVDFSLRCHGDSMINARIFDGDIVFIRQQPDVDDGDIAAVLIGDEATLKRVHKYPSKLVLSPCNPLYDDLIYTDEQLSTVRILGKAVAFVSSVR